MSKFDGLVNASMYITKTSIGAGGTMRWQAVNSDTDYDSYEERMSLELYEDFIGHVNNEEEMPEKFRSVACSEYWCGGMPYVSISHYPDLNGSAVPGETLELFVDGNKLKAKGVLFNSPLGHSVWRSLKEDKVKPPEEKIRISIGFLDLAHRHGDGELWVRESATSLCPECMQGIGDKVYVKGYLVHLALTRVPVNKRTEMALEERAMPKKTRKDDAASIVGKDLADELDAKNKASALKSDVLIEMSEDEVETPETPEVPVTEPVVVESVAEAVEPEVEKMESAAPYLPYGGATSMKDANKYVEAKDEMVHLMDLWSMFSNVAWNIFDRNDVENKKAEFSKAIDEFKSMMASKAMLTFGMTERADPNLPLHPLQSAIDALLEQVDNSLQLQSDAERAQVLNPALQELGLSITDYLTKSVNEPAPDNDNNTLLNEIQNLIQPLVDSQKLLAEQVGMLEAKSNAQVVQPNNVRSRIPQPKTLSSAQVAVPVAPANSSSTPKLRDIINKSVGLS